MKTFVIKNEDARLTIDTLEMMLSSAGLVTEIKPGEESINTLKVTDDNAPEGDAPYPSFIIYEIEG